MKRSTAIISLTVPPRTAAPPVYRPLQPLQSLSVQRASAAPPAYCPAQNALFERRPAPPACSIAQSSSVQQRPTITAAPSEYRPTQSSTIQQRPIAAPPVYRPAQSLTIQQRPSAAPLRGDAIQSVRKSGKRRNKLTQRSALERKAQSERDKADAVDAQLRKRRDGDLYSGLNKDEIAWKVAKGTTHGSLPTTELELNPNSASLQNMGLEADTRFSTSNGLKIIVRYDETVPSERHQRRVGRLAQTFTHELYVHGRHGIARDDPDQDHLEMHDPATRDAYLAITKQALGRLQNRAQERAFLDAWKQDMRFQIDIAGLTDTERRKRREWVDTKYRYLMPK